MKRFALAIALACALTGTALAGEIHTTGVQEPDPSGSSSAAPASNGEIHTTGATQESSDMLAAVILTIMGLAFS